MNLISSMPDTTTSGSITSSFCGILLSYSTLERMYLMQLSLAFFLLSERMMAQGEMVRLVSLILDWNRRICSSLETEKKNLNMLIPFLTNISSINGTSFKKRLCSSSVQNPMVGSTMARLYQLRSNRTISPPDGG